MSFRSLRKIETVDCIQEEERPNPLVKVFAAVPEPFEFRHFGLELARGGSSAERVKRAVSNVGIARDDDGPEFAHAPAPFTENISRAAKRLTISARTSSRSFPFN